MVDDGFDTNLGATERRVEGWQSGIEERAEHAGTLSRRLAMSTGRAGARAFAGSCSVSAAAESSNASGAVLPLVKRRNAVELPLAREAVLELLSSAGVQDLNAEVYLAVLRQPGQDVACLAADLGVEPSRVREVLANLIRVSLLHGNPVDPDDVLVPNPATALAAQLAEQEARLEERRAQLARTKAAAAELEVRWHRAVGCGIERVIDATAVRATLRRLTDETENEVLVLVPDVSDVEAHAPEPTAVESCLSRGISVRGVFTAAGSNHLATRRYLQTLSDAGAQLRFTPAPPARILLFDRRTAVVLTGASERDPGCLTVRSGELAGALTALFESVWVNAEPDTGATCGDDMSGQDRQILRLMKSGITDEGVSRQLGVSVRTVRRNIAGLLKRLNARSRFEAGYEVARRGLL